MKKLPQGWKRGRLSNLVERLDSGISFTCQDVPPADDEIAVLKLNCVSGGRFDPTAAKRVNQKDLGRLTLFARGERVIISRSNTPLLVGACAFVPRDFPRLFLPDTLWQMEFRAGVEVDARWLTSLLQSKPYRKLIASIASGTSGSMKKLQKPSLLRIPVVIPSIAEQRRIGLIFGTLNREVETLEMFIAAQVKRKRGLMQQLLTGQTRFKEFVKSGKKVKTRYGDFPEDWWQVHIGDIADEAGKKNGSGRELPVLSCTKHRGLVNSLEYFGKRIFSENTSTYRIVERGDFAYATNHVEEGSIGYQNLHDAALIS
jgi:type I restriction enzyme S subunit